MGSAPRLLRVLLTSAQVIDDIGVWSGVSRVVGFLHEHAFEPGAVVAGEQSAVGVVAGGVHAGNEPGKAAVAGQRFTGVEKCFEPLPGTGAGADRLARHRLD